MSARSAPMLAVAATATVSSPLRTLGVWLLIAYLLFIQSRVLDFTAPRLHLPLILCFVTTCLAVISGNLLGGLRTTIGRSLPLFVFVLGLSTLFSINRYQSAVIMMGQFRYLIMAFTMMALLISLRDIGRALQAMAWGTLLAAILGFLFQADLHGDRLGLAIGRFGDPNDYAMMLILGLPFWLTVGSGILRVVLGLPAATIIFVSFARTGSRGGLIAFGSLTIAYFFFSSLMGKLRVLFLIATALVLGLIIVPENIQRRYVTIFNSDASEVNSESQMARIQSDILSTNSRLALLFASITATIKHPVFGVGPGNFPEYYWKQGYIEENRNRLGMHTHNTYTQVSSEAGIPAAICWIVILGFALRIAWRAGHEKLLPEGHPVRIYGRALFLSIFGWATAATFLSTAWTEIIFFYVAMTSSLSLIHRDAVAEVRRLAAAGEKPGEKPPGVRLGTPALPRPTRPLLRPVS